MCLFNSLKSNKTVISDLKNYCCKKHIVIDIFQRLEIFKKIDIYSNIYNNVF